MRNLRAVRGFKGYLVRLLCLILSAGMVLMGLPGCGGHTLFTGTPPGSYPLTVTATSATASGNTTITLNVIGPTR